MQADLGRPLHSQLDIGATLTSGYVLRLRRAQTISASSMIRPMAIAEIGGAAGESIGSHRSPDGIAQLCAGIHHDDQIAVPTDVEAELPRSHAKARIADQYPGIPQNGGTAAKRGGPTGGSRQVIDNRLVEVFEHILTKVGSIALEIDSPQAGAVSKRQIPDVGDAAAECDVPQIAAERECY